MTDRRFSPRLLTVAGARSVARGASRLFLPALVWAATLCLTLPVRADFTQGNVPKLTASDPVGSAEKQGFSAAVSADGSTAIVGGPFDNSGAGAAWVFVRSGETWTQQQKLTVSDASGYSELGWSVALSADGDTAIVGGPGDNGSSGAAWVFGRNSSGVWSPQAKLSGNDAVGSAEQGYSVALSRDGTTALIGGWADSSALGAAWVFTLGGGTWSQQGAKLSGSGATNTINIMQGFSVALSDDGTTAIIGGPNDGFVTVNAAGSTTNAAIGAAWVFKLNGGVWGQQGNKLVGENGEESQQGFSVALSSDGKTAIVGGPGEQTSGTGTTETTATLSKGAAWVFAFNGSTWKQQGDKLVGTSAALSSPGKGFSVSLGGGGKTALVGGPTDNANTGATWVFTLGSDGTWNEQEKLIGTGAVGVAGQATSVALSHDGYTAIVGGPLDQDETGAAWVFRRLFTLTVSDSGNGTITSDPAGIDCMATSGTCDASYAGGTMVTLSATPDNGYAFGGWSGACGGYSSCTVTMSKAQSVTATFVQGFVLTVGDTGGGNGTVTSSPSGISCGSSCSGDFAPNSEVILDATPISGSSFAGWSGACSGSGSCVVTMAAAENVTATFILNSGGSGGAGGTGGSGGQSATAQFVDPESGNDSGSCPQIEPCLTLDYALSQATVGGTIMIENAGTFGPVYLTGAITISGPAGATVTIVNDGSAPGCIGVSAGSCASGDPNNAAIEIAAGNTDRITLSNLTAASGAHGIAAVRVNAAFAVSLETVELRAGAANSGLAAVLYDVSTVQSADGSPHQLFVHDCDLSANSAGGGVFIDPAVPTAASLNGGQVHNATFGIKLNAAAVASGSSVNAVIDNMELFGFGTNAIVVAATGSGLATASVSRSTISQAVNSAVRIDGAGATVLLHDDTFNFNTSGIWNAANGAAYTFGSNAIDANGDNVFGFLTGVPAGAGGTTQ